MNSFDSQRSSQDSMKRRWQSFNHHHQISSNSFLFTKIMGAPPSNSCPPPSSVPTFSRNPSFQSKLQYSFPGLDSDDLVSAVVPPVTVAFEGRSICQRISLHKHESYQSLARALRQMFVDDAETGKVDDAGKDKETDELDLSNAIPGYLIAYEDMENDLLLAGDLKWKDFVRVAKRIRILPAKSNSRKSPRRSAA